MDAQNIGMDANLYSLPTELLILIFKNLEFEDILTMRLTCHRFKSIVNNYLLELHMRNDMLVTNQLAPEMQARSKIELSILGKTIVSKNWINRRYYSHYIKRRKTISSCIFLEKHCVWVNIRKSVKCFSKRYDSKIGGTIRSLTNEGQEREIYKFVYKQDCVISGLVDGSLWIWCPKFDKRVQHYKNCHSMEITAVDLHGGIFATGSKDKFFTLWPLNLENPPTELTPLYTQSTNDVVSCTRFSPTGERLNVGATGCKSSVISIYDVESNRQLHIDSKHSSGLLDIKWESPNIFWSCDSHGVCKWDLREKEPRKEVCSQFNMTCFDYDHFCTVIVGYYGGEIEIYDTRKVNTTPVTKLHPCNSSDMTSLAFDATHLYVATKHYYNIFDFRFPIIKSCRYFETCSRKYKLCDWDELLFL